MGRGVPNFAKSFVIFSINFIYTFLREIVKLEAFKNKKCNLV